jgi:site-specific DNA recombinase
MFDQPYANGATGVTAMVNRFETDRLTSWLERKPDKKANRGRTIFATPVGLRFAFYGRVSTKEFQDGPSSRSWQYTAAQDLIAGCGSIVIEFFDTGHSHRRPWNDRPQAAALLATLAAPDRGFDAIVVGEYERAFYSDQLSQLLPLLDQHGIQIWLPEAHGPINIQDPSHHALAMLLGAQSKREVQRSRFRVLAAMRAQAREQGRYLGGRPPYGYRLTDADPHPNTAHAQWGRRLP